MSEAGKGASAGALPLRPARKCPICGRRAVRDAYPFCSRRCADRDLANWLSGAYVIPGPADESEAGREEAE